MRLLLAAAGSVAACDGWGTGLGRRAHGAPQAIGRLDAFTIMGRTHVAVSPLFTDPDGDSLTLTVESKFPDELRASVWGSFVELRPVGSAGRAGVLVTATDPTGLRDTLSIAVQIRPQIPPDDFNPPNPEQPRARYPMASRQLLLGELTTISLELLFHVGSSTMFSAASSSAAVHALTSGDSLVLEPRSLGPAQITVTAFNDAVASVNPVHQVFDVVVDPPGTPHNSAPGSPLLWGLFPAVIPVGVSIPYDASEFFRDPEERPLTFTATSDAPNRVAMSVSGSNVILEGKRRGEAVVTLVATDHGGLPVRRPLPVSVIGWIDSR